MNNNDDYERGHDSGGINPITMIKGIVILIGAFFVPSFIIAILVFLVFMRWLKWRPSVTFFPLAFVFTLLLAFLYIPLENLRQMSGLSALKDEWQSIIFSYLYIATMVGIAFGYIYIIYKVIDLNRYPEYVHMTGWAYGFEYAPTPLEKFRKKRNMNSLREGKEFDYEKAPIGVIDEPVVNDDLEGTLDFKNSNNASIVYRYYTEAMAHTLITGKTGSGKALHIDTPIRIKEKGWTTVGEAEIGDTLYDENGNHTELLAIYKPMTKDHYELTFEGGEIVKACGDHLWNIGDVEEGNTVDTRTLFENYSYKTPYEINHSIDGFRKYHKILKVRIIKDKPEDYVCFTVDSPSKLFLITESLIPTHNTVTMLSLIQNDIIIGNPVCVIDFKKSPDLIYFLSKWAKENNREFYHFVSGKPGTYKNPYKDNQATYDPLSTGGATAKADMILNLRTWDTASEVFKKRTQDVLQSLFFLLERTPKKAVPGIEWGNGGLAKFVSALNLNNFRAMIEYMAKDMQAGKLSPGDIRRYNTLVDLYKELSSNKKSDLVAQITELLSIARTLMVSNYGDWLATGASDYHIDLMDIATSSEAPIVLFSFNQQEEPEFAKYIGSIVMSDLSRVSALKNAQGDVTNFGVYIDEFQTLDPRTVKDNLEKARSSKMYITLSLQSIDQIVSAVDSAGEAMATAILDTCANFIFHDGSGYDTAERMSKIIGKSNKYIYRTTSNEKPGLISRLISIDKAMVSKDIQQDWLVPPSEFQSLESPVSSNGYKSTAYVVNKSSDDTRFKRSGGALARKVHVVVEEETAKGVSNDFKKQIFIPSVNEPEFEEIQVKIMNEYNSNGFSHTNENHKPISQETTLEGLLPNNANKEENEEWVVEDDVGEVNDLNTITPVEDVQEKMKESPLDNLPENYNQPKKPDNYQLPDIKIEKDVLETKQNKIVDNSIPQKGKSASQLDVFKQLKNGKKKVETAEKPKEEEVSLKLPKLD